MNGWHGVNAAQTEANRQNGAKRCAGWWTDERCERLGYLWGLGWHASEIAAALGTTKNAVLGKAMRCQLEYHLHAERFNPHLRPRQ